MKSRHLQCLEHIETQLKTLPIITGGVWFERTDAFLRGFENAINIRPDLAPLEPDSTCRGTWTMRLYVDILVELGPVMKVADPIWCAVHSLLMADQSVGGTANSIEPFPRTEGNEPAVRWLPVDGENQPGVLSTAWLVRVRTMEGDLTQ